MNKRQKKKQWCNRKLPMRERKYPAFMVSTSLRWSQLLFGTVPDNDTSRCDSGDMSLKPLSSIEHRTSAGFGYWVIEPCDKKIEFKATAVNEAMSCGYPPETSTLPDLEVNLGDAKLVPVEITSMRDKAKVIEPPDRPYAEEGEKFEIGGNWQTITKNLAPGDDDTSGG